MNKIEINKKGSKWEIVVVVINVLVILEGVQSPIADMQPI